jgi:hypothetical protein
MEGTAMSREVRAVLVLVVAAAAGADYEILRKYRDRFDVDIVALQDATVRKMICSRG